MPADHEKKTGNPFLLWGSVLIAVVVIVAAVRYLTRERVAVRTARASYQDVTKTSSTNGKVEPVDDFVASSQAPGVVDDIYVSVGDHVRAGQLLMKMEDADVRASLAHAQSALQAAELAGSDLQHGGSQDERNTFASDLARASAQLAQDQTLLATRQQLLASGADSPAEVADAKQRVQADQQSLASIQQHSTQRYGDADRARSQAQVADAQAGVVAARKSFANADIRSQLDGTVYAIPVSRYDYVAAGSDLIYVADLNRIQITAYFDEPEIGNLAAGQPVKIVWDAKPDHVWHGHITIAPTSVTNYQNTRSVGEAFITVDDAQGDLPPNANVTVTVTTALHHHVLTVPHEALHTDAAQPYVYRVIRDRLVHTPVQLAGGIVNYTRAEIVSGLSEGDVVALGATTSRDLADGLEVTSTQ